MYIYICVYIYIYILESRARFARAQSSLTWDSPGGQNLSKLDFRRLSLAKRARNEFRKSRSTSVPPMEMRKHLDFGLHLGRRGRAKSIRNRVEMVLRMTTKNIDVSFGFPNSTELNKKTHTTKKRLFRLSVETGFILRCKLQRCKLRFQN